MLPGGNVLVFFPSALSLACLCLCTSLCLSLSLCVSFSLSPQPAGTGLLPPMRGPQDRAQPLRCLHPRCPQRPGLLPSLGAALGRAVRSSGAAGTFCSPLSGGDRRLQPRRLPAPAWLAEMRAGCRAGSEAAAQRTNRIFFCN